MHYLVGNPENEFSNEDGQIAIYLYDSSVDILHRDDFSGQFFRIFGVYYFLLCCCYMRPSARCGIYISPFLCANSIWKSFLKYE